MGDQLKYHVKDFIENGRDFVLARVMNTQGSTPRKAGAVMVLTDEGEFLGTVGGGRIEAAAQEECRRAMESGQPEGSRVYHYALKKEGVNPLDMGCGGEADVLIEYVHADNPGKVMRYFASGTTAYLFGGGHVALAVEPILRHIDFETVVIEDRPEYMSEERFPAARERILVDDFRNAFDRIHCDENSYLIIVTRGHRNDLDVLREALRRPHAYLGMIGSRHKNNLLYEQLRKEGFAQEELDKVYAPIGENIYAETPEEIGVSIAAELIRVRNGHGTR
ncbi:MAG: XdhC family protein [Anaerovoracaceae bacterium]|jgi:xanthine dehydrogenase accessory factor